MAKAESSIVSNAGAMTFKPSTAEITESAGVIAASP